MFTIPKLILTGLVPHIEERHEKEMIYIYEGLGSISLRTASSLVNLPQKKCQNEKMKEEELKKIVPAGKDKDVKYILQII